MTGRSLIITEQGEGSGRRQPAHGTPRLSVLGLWPSAAWFLRHVLVAQLLIVGGLSPPSTRAQSPSVETPASGEQPNDASPLRFRRVYAPTDRPEAWPRQQMPYFPVQPADFERLLRQARTTAQMGDTSVSVTIASGQYKARLVGEDLVDGEAMLEVLHSSNHRTMLSLAPCGLAINHGEWAGEDGQPAELGQGPDGKLGVLVERPGSLQLNWSLRGKRDAHGIVELVLEFPHSPSTRLILELPESTTPVTDCGIVTKEPASFDQTRHWRIELGGHERVQLRIVPTAELELRRRQARVRQSLVYDFTLHGLELSAQLQFDAPDEPLRQIIVALDPGLRLVTARYGSVAIPWSTMAPASDRPGTRVVLELPEPLQGTGRSVRLGLLAPLQQGVPWRLPKVHPEGAHWQEGNATLLVASPLVIEQLTPIQSRQVKVNPMPAPGSGESMELQYFTAGAGVELVLGRPQAPLQLDCGTAVELDGGDMTARVVADFTVADGEVFDLAAEVAKQWIIDSVESLPGEALGDWNLEKNAEGAPKLTIRLAKALSPSRPVRLQITGRRLHSPLGRWLGVNELIPLQFAASAGGRRLVTLRSVEPYQLKTTGTDRLAVVDPQSLDPAAARLLNGSTGSLLFERDAGAEDLRVSVERQSPQYAATIRVEAAAMEDLLVESYRLSCIPAAAPVDRLLVRLSHRRNMPLRWTLVNDEADALTVRPLAEPAAAGDAVAEETEGEIWEIVLQQPKSEPFEIRASRKSPLAKEGPISLAALPEASSQRATLLVAATDAHVVRVAGNQLEPIPIEAAPADQYTSVRATYRYYPTHSSAPSPEAILAVHPRSSTTTLPTVWAWNCQLESRYEPTGRGHHLALYRLQSAGRRQLQVTLPHGVQANDVRGIWVGDTRASWQTEGTKEQRRLAVDLPAGQRFPVVAIHFTTAASPLRLIRRLSPSPPELDIPVLSCQWTVWLPPGYQAVDPDVHWQPRRPEPLTWTQRLFGPLGREAASAPFNPLSLNDWFNLRGDRSTRLSVEGKARRILEALGEATANARNRTPEGLVWHTALSLPTVESILADQSNGQRRSVLLIDQQALAQLGINPNTPLPRLVSGTASTRGAAALHHAGLTLLVHPAAIVITSERNAALERDGLEPGDHGTLWWIRPGPLAERVQRAIASQGDTLVRVAAWKVCPTEGTSPWERDQSVGLQPTDTRGWNAYQLEIPGTAAVDLTVLHRNGIQAIRWTVFLVVTALTCWSPLRRPLVLVSLGAMSAFAALLLPTGYVPFASGVLLGLLFSLVFRLMGRVEEARPEPKASVASTDSSPLHKPTNGMVVLLVVLSSSMSGLTLGAEPNQGEPSLSPPPMRQPPPLPAASSTPPTEPLPGRPETKPSPTYNVLIPVDQNDKPTGEPYQVPEGLYKELHRRAAAGTEEPQGWLLTSATYRGSLVWQGPPERLAPGELKARFSLQVFNPQTQVRLRLGHHGINLVPDGATLDGRLIQPEWQEDGRVLAFDVADTGPYQLELTLRPVPPNDATADGFDLNIPRLANSQLELAVPANAPAIEIPSAKGVVVREVDPPRVLAELGPSERLSVRWQDTKGAVRAGPAIDMEELLWLKVQPDSVVLDARFRFRILEGRVRELWLQTDPRLRLLPFQGTNAPTAEVHAVSGQRQMIRLAFPRPISDQMELAASFLLTETSGIGHLRLPEIEVQGVRTTKRWMAIWVDPALQYEQQLSNRLEAVAVPVFSAAWGPALVPPLGAYSLPPGGSPWGLATRPREPSTTVTQALALSVDPREVQVQLDAQLETTAGYNFQYRILAPSELEVEKVSLQAQELDHVARWSRTPDGTITVFLNAPVDGVQRLVIRGRLPVGKRSSLLLPVLQIAGAETQSHTVQLFRKPAVLVRVVDTKGLAEMASPVAEENMAALGRLVKSFHAQGNAPVQIKVALTTNRPKVRAMQRTSVRFDGEQREAKVDFQIQVERGLVDQWRLEVPAQWSGPYQVDPPATVKAVTIPGDRRRRLIIQPNATVSGECRLQVSSPLSLAPGERVCAPAVALEDALLTRHLLVLPTQWQLHPVVWETQGLKQVPLPEDLDRKPVGRESFVAYQAEHPAFQAILKPVVGIPQVFLADISLAWQTEGTCRGVALFDLQSAGLSHCRLRMPQGQELVQVTVAGVPTTPVRDTDQSWHVPLSPSAFPQRLEVLFRGRLAASSTNGACRLESPLLDAFSVRQTLWTIIGPSFCHASVPKGVTLVSRLEQEMTRLRNVNTLIEQAAEATTEEPEQTVQWYRAWAGRWLALSEEIRRQLALPAADTPKAQAERQAATKELESISGQQAPVASRLAGTQVVAQQGSETPQVSSPHRLGLSGPDGSVRALRCVTEGEASTLLLDYRPTEPNSFVLRLGDVFLLGILALLVVWGMRRGDFLALVQRRPHTAGVLVGLAWWLWLWPSAFGWVVVLASVVDAIRPGGRRSQKPASRVVTITSRKR